MHRIIRHAWETPYARIAMFSQTVKNAQAGGVWSDLIETCLPEWIDAGIGLKITVPPKVDGATRLHYFCMNNVFGNESRIQLHSLDYDFDIEPSIKGMRFSMVYFSELSNFRNRLVFDVVTESLRMPHLKFGEHMFLGDCNPSDEGESSWIFRLWYQYRLQDTEVRTNFQKELHLIELMIPDNPYLTDTEREDIVARYSHDPDLKARYVEGRWTLSTRDSHFTDVFFPETHILGNVSSFNEDEHEVLLPSDTCSKLVCGWDLGSRNHAAVIIESLTINDQTFYHVIDECVVLDSNQPLGDFVDFFIMRHDYWLDYIKKLHSKPVEILHWSDSSSFDQFRSASANYDHNVVAAHSGGKVMLRAAPKGPGSVMKRVDIVRRLLFSNRLFISASCVNIIQMLRSLKRGKTKAEYVQRSPHSHVFDALSYCLFSECAWEVQMDWVPHVNTTSKIVSVPI